MSYSNARPGDGGTMIRLVIYWAFVGIPLLWGVSETIAKATRLFR